MAWHPLDDAYDELQGARNQLGSLTTKTVRYFEKNSDKISFDYAFDGTYDTLHIHRIPAFPTSWARDVTQIANAARAALDYSIGQLSEVAGTGPGKYKTCF